MPNYIGKRTKNCSDPFLRRSFYFRGLPCFYVDASRYNRLQIYGNKTYGLESMYKPCRFEMASAWTQLYSLSTEGSEEAGTWF